MDKPNIKMTLQGSCDCDGESCEVVPTIGSKIQIEFEDASTEFSIDYSNPDSLNLAISGRFRILGGEDSQLTLGADAAHDVLKRSTVFEGSMVLEIGQHWEVEIHGSTGSDGQTVGAGLTLNF